MPTCVQKKRGNKKIMENVGYLQCYVSFRIHKCSMYLKKILDCHEMRHLEGKNLFPYSYNMMWIYTQLYNESIPIPSH